MSRYFAPLMGLALAAAALASDGPAAVQATLQPDGNTRVTAGGQRVADIKPFAFGPGWNYQTGGLDRTAPTPADVAAGDAQRSLALDKLAVDLRVTPPRGDEPMRLRARFTATEDAFFEAVGMVADFAAPAVAGGVATLGDAEVPLPAKHEKDQLGWSNGARRIVIPGAAFGTATIETAADAPMGINDNRRWNQAVFPVQIHAGGAKQWKKGETREVAFTVRLPAAVTFTSSAPAPAKTIAPAVAADQVKDLRVRIPADGNFEICLGDARVGQLFPFGFAPGWQQRKAVAGGPGPQGGAGDITRRAVVDNALDVDLFVSPAADGKSARYRAVFTAKKDAAFESAGVWFSLPTDDANGLDAVFDDESVALPPTFENDRTSLGAFNTTSAVGLPSRRFGLVGLRFPKPTRTSIGDNRKWNDKQFPVQILLPGGRQWKAGETRELAFTVDLVAAARFVDDGPLVARAGPDWAVMPLAGFEITPGSALDFTDAPWRHKPAGRFGRARVDPASGKFVFADDPAKTPRRFYGTNFCYNSQYLDGDRPERLARRMAAIGYNAVRLHHYEEPGNWMFPRLVGENPADMTTLNPQALDLLDRFFAAMKAEGLYVTTDLLINARGPRQAVWPDHPNGNAAFNLRAAAPVNDKAFDLWAGFTKALLTHRNPHTGLTWGEDPALSFISLVNEGNIGNHPHMDSIKRDRHMREDWTKAWNAWLADRVKKGGDIVKNAALDGDPAAGTVPFGEGINVYWTDNPKAAARLALQREFLCDVEVKFYAKMRDFIRGLGCEALLTNTNGWTNDPLSPVQRAEYDYVDDHFYLESPDHRARPRPYKNLDPVKNGLLGGLDNAWLRVAGKPFTITEFNHGNPSRHRGYTGVASPAFAAMQDWDALWRFGYSHGNLDRNEKRDLLFEPAPSIHTLDLVSDPLQLHTERAAMCLFLRRDIDVADAALLVRGSADDFKAVNARFGDFYRDDEGKDHKLLQPPYPVAKWAAAGARVALLADGPGADAAARAFGAGALVVKPQEAYDFKGEKALLAKLAAKGWPGAEATAGRVGRGRRVETRQFALDPASGALRVDTPRTAAVAGPAGATLELKDVTWSLGGNWAVAWVSSLEADKPVASAGRLLVQHLTDVLATNTSFTDASRSGVTSDGEMPWLALAGSAELTIRRAAGAPALKCWALDYNGNRHEEIPVVRQGDTLKVALAVHGRDGANLAYELAVE